MEPSADSPAGSESDENGRHRCTRALPLIEQREEIDCVLGDHDAILVNCPSEHIGVRRTAEPEVPDMDCIVPALDENLSDAFGVHLIDQKPHPVNTEARATVNSRTRSAASSFAWSLASISSRCSAA